MYVVKRFDPWKSSLCTCPPKYSLQPYTGCSHKCLYCYVTSYIKARKAKPKKDFIQKLIADLRKIDLSLPINMSTSSDPYTPEEGKFILTRRALEIMVPKAAKILITTKGTILQRDIDIISQGNVAVMVTITTLDDSLASIIEPYAPRPSARLKMLEILGNNKVPFGVRIDPIIPYINDDLGTLKDLVDIVVNLGAKHIVTSTYKARPDSLRRLTNAFPDLENKLNRLYSKESPKISNYRYLPADKRKSLLMPIIQRAIDRGVSVATCREGFGMHAPSCDGSHLIPIRIRAKTKKFRDMEIPKIIL
ncbi:MAG: radical SAM protein [Candidatus Njordarchaeota archaeon]